MKKRKSNLDERQEQKLKEIESRGCWLALWGLLAVSLAEIIIYGWDFSHMAGEWLIIMILSLYIVIACVKNGIWDRRLKMNTKTNLLCSIAAGLGLALVYFITLYIRYPDRPAGAASAAVLIGIFTFVLVFIAITFTASLTKKRQRLLEAEPEEDEE